ncbi:MAG TPA: hypothetical protein VMT46_05780 [Anaerolineaceae bacterium]|nr:hypothetical protein [Anaerolineaceae bacterium]
MENNNTWKTRVMIIGAAIGLLTGLGAAYIILQRAEQQNVEPRLSTGEGVKVGLGVLGLLRMIADIGKD